ncbi:hypothetical protein M8C17_19765 [Micromonospora sp. RHAY321]|uniref:hypothetical protein n=1 Tax=Micromonospora sp. RHAY321 TaxID=2944807 RepID=UPI00207CBCDC|nr:hypothetical protein [Micromonospora sp. RHAY321]MCO1597393.1 hypothetical protein [Micromonospora sp. RHAY321]
MNSDGQSSTTRPVKASADARATATGRAPRWFKVLAVVGAALLLLVIAMLLAGHGPGRHMHGAAAAVGASPVVTLGVDSGRGACRSCA